MAALIRRVLRRSKDERGAELIEFALVFPILLLVVAGIADFGFLFQRYEVVTNAAREGARMASLPSYTQSDVTQRVTSYLTMGGLTLAPTVSVTWAPTTVGSNTFQVATVTVEYPHQFNIISPIAAMVGGSNFGTITLRSRSVMRVEGS
jgi:Flp pilus assembly protein TadG